ncbi:hypothetical protein [Nocardia sp. NPDC050710]|uniref:hypothetical protein n=1 Tax=Nocardia sp. NPDC050710 TaxID=3157220 RepID=UPI0034108D93
MRNWMNSTTGTSRALAGGATSIDGAVDEEVVPLDRTADQSHSHEPAQFFRSVAAESGFEVIAISKMTVPEPM